MTDARWETVRVEMCERVGKRAALELHCVYPAEFLPDQPPHVIARRCSLGVSCNLLETPGCCFAGTLPAFDPHRP